MCSKNKVPLLKIELTNIFSITMKFMRECEGIRLIQKRNQPKIECIDLPTPQMHLHLQRRSRIKYEQREKEKRKEYVQDKNHLTILTYSSISIDNRSLEF